MQRGRRETARRKPSDAERIEWWCDRHRGVTVRDMSRWTRLSIDQVEALCPPKFRKRDELV